VKILNVGCGNETYGTDFVDVYPLRKEVIKCNVNEENLPYADETFDLVYSKNLLEHLSNPLHFFLEMKRVLKKNGTIYLLTDNAAFLLFHINLRKNNYLQHNSNTPRVGDKDRHYFLFTPLHLKNFLDTAGGFNDIKTMYEYSSTHKTAIFLSKILISRVFKPHIVLTASKK